MSKTLTAIERMVALLMGGINQRAVVFQDHLSIHCRTFKDEKGEKIIGFALDIDVENARLCTKFWDHLLDIIQDKNPNTNVDELDYRDGEGAVHVDHLNQVEVELVFSRMIDAHSEAFEEDASDLKIFFESLGQFNHHSVIDSIKEVLLWTVAFFGSKTDIFALEGPSEEDELKGQLSDEEEHNLNQLIRGQPHQVQGYQVKPFELPTFA